MTVTFLDFDDDGQPYIWETCSGSDRRLMQEILDTAMRHSEETDPDRNRRISEWRAQSQAYRDDRR